MITEPVPKPSNSKSSTRSSVKNGARNSTQNRPPTSARTVNLHIDVVNIQPEHIRALVRLQHLSFPTLSEREYLTEAQYRNHLELFPEGQFVALARVEGKMIPVGSTSTFRTDFDFDHIQHTFLDAVADGWLTNHDPNGDWLYGADMNVHPQFRGMRIGGRLYEARQGLVRRLNLRGEIAGALLPGYQRHADKLSVAQYVLRVHQTRLHDPTLSMQLRNGFGVKGILYDHISDPRSNNCATLIVRENPYYHPKRPEG